MKQTKKALKAERLERKRLARVDRELALKRREPDQGSGTAAPDA
jgi:hypothetical protein